MIVCQKGPRKKITNRKGSRKGSQLSKINWSRLVEEDWCFFNSSALFKRDEIDNYEFYSEVQALGLSDYNSTGSRFHYADPF